MKYLPALLLLFITSCAASGGESSYQSYLLERNIPLSTKNTLSHCHGYGCKFVTSVPVSKSEWKQIKKAFTPPSKDAAQERNRLAIAIGMFETIAGAKTGTAQDERGTFRHLGDDQLDCVDESTNTTNYLSVLYKEGLLKFHTVQAPTVRIPIIHAGRWPHQTAVIREKNSGVLYAVDSWFHDNGEDAEIIELEKWKEGWKPDSVHDLL